MPKSEIVDTHDYNLNIRRYVDNTPEPEPEDVQAHLIGGIPEAEVAARAADFAKFGVDPDSLFEPERPDYLAFPESIDAKPAIKAKLEADPAVLGTLTRHHDALESWWAVARDDFAQLQHAGNGGKKMPEVRHELLTTLKAKLVPLGVLDEFKGAGVFVNWWQRIRFDLKTIVSTGWHHTLIPDDYLIAEYFQAEADAIEALEATIAEAQGELSEAVETAQEISGYEPDEDEKVTAAVIKKALKALIEDLKDSAGASAKKELKNLTDPDKAIKAIEKRIKNARATLKEKAAELEFKLELKRLGTDDFKAETQALVAQADARLAGLDPKKKADKKTITALAKDKEALNARLARTDAVLKAIGGQISEADARRLILKKIYDIARAELDRYLMRRSRYSCERLRIYGRSTPSQRTNWRVIERPRWPRWAVSLRDWGTSNENANRSKPTLLCHARKGKAACCATILRARCRPILDTGVSAHGWRVRIGQGCTSLCSC